MMEGLVVLLLAAGAAVAGAKGEGLPVPVASWDFGSPEPFKDTINGYTLQQHDQIHPVVCLLALSAV